MVGLIGVAVLAVVLVTFVDHSTTAATPMAAASAATPTSPQEILASPNMRQRFDALSQAHTDSCAHLGDKPAIYAAMANMSQGSYLQGSCCTPMDFQHYQRQVAGLQAYANIPQIPADRYKVPASLAENLLQDDQTISLTATQQATYDQAVHMTNDHGWCCCQCWAWYAHSGLAKYLIIAHSFSATQVAAVTDLEDCCGGALRSDGRDGRPRRSRHGDRLDVCQLGSSGTPRC